MVNELKEDSNKQMHDISKSIKDLDKKVSNTDEKFSKEIEIPGDKMKLLEMQNSNKI
jgi:hypothetical protein